MPAWGCMGLHGAAWAAWGCMGLQRWAVKGPVMGLQRWAVKGPVMGLLLGGGCWGCSGSRGCAAAGVSAAAVGLGSSGPLR